MALRGELGLSGVTIDTTFLSGRVLPSTESSGVSGTFPPSHMPCFSHPRYNFQFLCITYSAVSHLRLVSEEPLSQVLSLLLLLPLGVANRLLRRIRRREATKLSCPIHTFICIIYL